MPPPHTHRHMCIYIQYIQYAYCIYTKYIYIYIYTLQLLTNVRTPTTTTPPTTTTITTTCYHRDRVLFCSKLNDSNIHDHLHCMLAAATQYHQCSCSAITTGHVATDTALELNAAVESVKTTLTEHFAPMIERVQISSARGS